MCTNCKKPPLGLTPRFIVEEHRIDDIHQAIMRYKQANMEVPKEWIEEYIDLIKCKG